jgi:hypothetical protein
LAVTVFSVSFLSADAAITAHLARAPARSP